MCAESQSDLDGWFEMGSQFYNAIPVFGPIWNDLCEKAGFRSDSHVLGLLLRRFKSIMVIGQHVFYSSTCVLRHSRAEASNVYADYVQFHFYNFITRVKTSLDMHALMLNHVYGFGIDGKACLLEKGPLASSLHSDGGNRVLASYLDRERNAWIRPFVDMRNLLLHRVVVDFIVGSLDGVSLVQVPAGEMLRIPEERRILEDFLGGVGLVVPASCVLDPVVICNALCEKWKALSCSVLAQSESCVRRYIQEHE